MENPFQFRQFHSLSSGFSPKVVLVGSYLLTKFQLSSFKGFGDLALKLSFSKISNLEYGVSFDRFGLKIAAAWDYLRMKSWLSSSNHC